MENKNYLRDAILQMVLDEELPKYLSPNLVLPKRSLIPKNNFIPIPSSLTAASPDSSLASTPLTTPTTEKRKKNQLVGEEDSEIQEFPPTKKKKKEKEPKSVEPPIPGEILTIQQLEPTILSTCSVCRQEFPKHFIVALDSLTGKIEACSNCLNPKRSKEASTISSFNSEEETFHPEMEEISATNVTTTSSFLIFGNGKDQNIVKDKTITKFSLPDDVQEIHDFDGKQILCIDLKNNKARVFDYEQGKETENFDFLFDNQFRAYDAQECFKCKQETHVFSVKSTPVGNRYICTKCSTKNSTTPTNLQYTVRSMKYTDGKFAPIAEFSENYQKVLAFPEQKLMFLCKDSVLSVYSLENKEVINELVLLDNEKLLEGKLTGTNFFMLLTSESYHIYDVVKNAFHDRIALSSMYGVFFLPTDFDKCCMCKKIRKFMTVDTLVGEEKICYTCLKYLPKKNKINQLNVIEYDARKKEIVKESLITNLNCDHAEVDTKTVIQVNKTEMEVKIDDKMVTVPFDKQYVAARYDPKYNRIIAVTDKQLEILDMKGKITNNFEISKGELVSIDRKPRKKSEKGVAIGVDPSLEAARHQIEIGLNTMHKKRKKLEKAKK